MNKTYFRFLGNRYDTLEDLIRDNTTYDDAQEYLWSVTKSIKLPLNLGEISLTHLIEKEFGCDKLYWSYVDYLVAELGGQLPTSFKGSIIEKVEEKICYQAVGGTQVHKNEILEDLLYDLIDEEELEYLFNGEYDRVYIGDKSFYPYDVAKWSGSTLLEDFKKKYSKEMAREVEYDLEEDPTTEFLGYAISVIKENVGTA